MMHAKGRRFAQAERKLCGSLDRDLATCPIFIPFNAELEARR